MAHHREPGEVHTSTYRSNRKDGTIYVYEKKSVYDPSVGYDRILSRTLLGKIPAGSSEMIPTRPRRKPSKPEESQEVEEPKEVKDKKTHLSYLRIIETFANRSGVTKQVKLAFRGDRGTWEKLLTAAWYCFATDGDTWPGMVQWTTKYVHNLPYATAISEDMYHDLFVKIGADESARQRIFLERAKLLETEHLLALDSTTIETFSENLNTPGSSQHKDKLIRKVYKVIYFYSMEGRQPVAYAKIPGNIADVSSVDRAVQELNAINLNKKHIEIVADSGYMTDENMGILIRNGYDFVLHAEARISWIAALIEENQERLNGMETIIDFAPEYTAIDVPVSRKLPYQRKRGNKEKNLQRGDIEYFTASLHVLIYYSTQQKGEDDRLFRTRFIGIKADLLKGAYVDEKDRKFADKYMIFQKDAEGNILKILPNVKEIQKLQRYHGYLVLITSKEKDPESGLLKYRHREYIEEDIKNHKAHTGENRPRKWHEDTLDGQLLVQFLALCMHESFESFLRNLKNTLALYNGDVEHDKVENMKLEAALKNWIRKTSLHNILKWYEACDYIEMRNGNQKTIVLDESKTKRDQLFLKRMEAQSAQE